MFHPTFNFQYNPEGDYYDLVLDKNIQQFVDELKALPHDVLIRYLTYWSDAIDSRKYEVESDLPHDEWYSDCRDYAASENDEERYMQAKCMAQTLGHMLQDIKVNNPDKYKGAMRTVRSWKRYRFIGFTPTMLYGQIFMSSYTCYQDLLYGEVTEDAFAFGYDYLVKGADAFE